MSFEDVYDPDLPTCISETCTILSRPPVIRVSDTFSEDEYNVHCELGYEHARVIYYTVGRNVVLCTIDPALSRGPAMRIKESRRYV